MPSVVIISSVFKVTAMNICLSGSSVKGFIEVKPCTFVSPPSFVAAEQNPQEDLSCGITISQSFFLFLLFPSRNSISGPHLNSSPPPLSIHPPPHFLLKLAPYSIFLLSITVSVSWSGRIPFNQSSGRPRPCTMLLTCTMIFV